MALSHCILYSGQTEADQRSVTGNILHKKQMKREIFLSAFLHSEKEKEIMYGKPFVRIFRDPVNKKQRDFQVSY